MENQTEEQLIKKRGNPNFGKKIELSQDFLDLEKTYHFVLTKTWEGYKPVDKEGGFMSSSPYPPIFALPNEGITIDDATGKNRRWRCLRGIDTIWVDEQEGVEPQSFEDYEDIIFSTGHLTVKGYERNKLAALLAHDTYEGKKYKKANVKPEYRLIDKDADTKRALDSLDVEYEALKKAKECSDEEMLPFAYVLGINLNQSLNTVRKDFIMRAKSNPSYFIKHFVDPKNNIIFKVKEALDNGIISSSVLENKLVWTESRKFITDVPKGSDVPQMVAKLVLQGDRDVVAAYEQLKKM